jgi:Flp pilus assembly pilin Flp
MLRFLFSFMDSESGQAHLEYALLVTLFAMGVMGSMEAAGATVSDWFFAVSGQLAAAVPGS